MIRYLSAEQILFIHHRLIADFGGTEGVLDINLLISAISRPQATFDGSELYPDIFSKAAALMDSLVRNHAFVDGNKRTAIASAGLFLQTNGYLLSVDNLEMARFTMSCAQSEVALDEMSAWLRQHSHRIA